ncbi:MAG: carboxymuconolactone decarboxylase family protein [Alphaproteobacteria bacterium]|nr:carboxymuconolactone decarboxylase family protein [Alphaproteobacteria bacterium]
MAEARIARLVPPLGAELSEILSGIMPPGREPLALFLTIAHNPRVLARLRAGSLLDRGSLSLREREIVIHRTTARLRCEYEWGVHVAFFAARAGFGAAEIAATCKLQVRPGIWSAAEQALIAAVDGLCDEAGWSDEVHSELARHFSPAQVIEIVALTGFYHMVAFHANALRIAPEPWAARFPADGIQKIAP